MAATAHANPGNRFVEFSREETDQSIVARFEKQVRKNPHRIAVQTSRVRIAYDDLNKSANRLARNLLQQFPENNPVAILMEHDAPVVVAILGALKASKIFIPLDPALPDARIGQILNDSGANVIVTNDQRQRTALDLVEGSRSIFNVDRYDTSVNIDNVDLKISPDSISYILYTSGSTGRPKGVIRTHRNDLHNIRHHTNSLCFSDDDRITLLGSFSTGQGIQDIFDALLNGATLFPRNLKSEGFNGLAEWLMKERITVYHSAATFFRHFVRNLSGEEKFPDLRVVRLGSEPVSWKDVESYKKHFSDVCVLANELSCSEANTISQFLVNKDTEINHTVPVGYPVEDKEILIVNERGDRLRPGEIGEIAVHSRYLSPGYWNRPDLTELAFIPDPESFTRRIYLTGDLGRQSVGCCLEHLGRKDTQVKIRGYRVECHEIELPLLRNPGVDQVFVTHRQDARGEAYLAAYIVPNRGATPTVTEMRASLTARLPDYMMPKAFVFIDALPLTPTGKIDRRALPEPAAARPLLDVPHATPRGPVEKSVAKLCSQILGVTVIGVHDNLFDLGGNSLSAMQIVARVMKTFRVNVPLNRFYESPTIAGLSAIITTTHGATEISEDSRILHHLQDRRLPLSYFQERLWFMEQWEPGKAAYNLSLAYRLKGGVNVGAMEESINAVIERHEVLRTSFVADNDQLSQIVAPILRLSLATIDLRTMPEAERNETSLHLAQESARRTFDLAHGPLLRSLLVQLDDEERLLVFTVHQIVCDGWSMRILFSEFWRSYEAISQNRLPSLPSISVQYADFAVWQRQLLSGEWIESQLSYWKETLCGTLPVLNFPTDRPRPALQSFRGSRIPIELSESVTAALNELSRQEGVTLFVTLMAAFKTLLYRYTGQEDIIVGFPIADRNWGEASGCIGFFVNTLVARTDLSGEPTFRDLLFIVRDVCVGAYAHQDLPFEKLVQELQLNRDLSRNPLFQVMFTFQNMPLAYPVVPELCSTPISIDNGTSKVDLTLSLAERESQLIGFFEYCTDLFDHTTIERMADHFRTLLECIIADRNHSIAKLAMLTEIERHQLLVEWNDTNADYSNGSCIHELFESQVEKTPDAIAVEYEEKKLTYREINGRANQLAHYLRGLGVGRESLVGICLERSVEMVIGVLGILKAGGAYLPLDPAYPTERLRFMLADAGVSVLLTVEELANRGWKPVLSKAEGTENDDPQMKVVRLDRDGRTIGGESKDNPRLGMSADGIAYVIYTSGSTGTPKGVVGLHRGAVNRFAWMWKTYPYEPAEKCCAKTSLSFVDSVWEIFGPLLQGVPLVLIPDAILKDPQRLVCCLRDNHVTRIGLVPSFLKTLLDVFPCLRDYVPELTLWSCSGEFLPKEVVERFQKSIPDSTLLNLYGSSEVSADVTCYDTRSTNLNRDIPVGRPLSNTQIYIVDSNLQPVPIGVPGELCVAGDGLALGYLNRPELTAEKFIFNPFSSDPRSRLYRTGDLARYRNDGNIEFIGRLDNQVKIRGYRIELGEVESALNEHSAVKDSVVVAQERESSSEKELVAYLVPIERSSLSVTELRSFLRGKLPEYMVPSIFVPLEVLPLMPNGKIDRNVLPAPDGARPDVDDGFVEPRTEIEELVTQVWREILKLDKIGVFDNFFELGGHSLLATRVVARLRSNFNIDLPLRKLFELPTVAALAAHIDILRYNQIGLSIPAIVPVPRRQHMPLSFSQRRLWFLHKLDPGLTAYNMPAVFRITGALNISLLEQALNEIVGRHEVLRTRILEIDGQPYQEIVPAIAFSLPVISLSHLSQNQVASEAERLSVEDAQEPYDLTQAPLMRAKLLRLGDEDHVFILNFHHIVADGSSLVVFYQEVATLYETYLRGKPSPLRPLSVQYADYAVWQNDWLRGEALETELDYWKGRLGNGLSPLQLPTDYERLAVQSYRGARYKSTLSNQLTKSLKELSRQQSVTMFMSLFATFNILLSRISSQEDIVMGSTIAGRNHPETDGLIGFFINALPLRCDLSGEPSFVTLLQRVRELCLDAFTNQDVPFDKIVEAIKPRREPGRNPIFDILFNVADTSERILTLAGCEVTKLAQVNPGAKFDIVLHAPEIAGKIEIAIVYNADLFRENRIVTLLEQFALLLAQVVDNPELPIGQLSLVTDASRTVLPDPKEALDDSWEGAIHELLAEQARRSPAKLAIVDSEQTWTYAELDRCANQLANGLIASGIQQKDLIAIYADRSSSLIVALFGILKAGASFLILDPAYPTARNSDYLRIAQPKGWLQLEGSGELPDELLSCLDSLEICCRMNVPQSKAEILDNLSSYPATKPETIVTAYDPAYVAFTSGSTGEPKGVLCRHGPITHFLPWQKEAFQLREEDRFAMLSGFAYSHLHRDVFTALSLGATLCIPNPSEARSPEHLARWLQRNAVTVLHLTPALGQLLLTSGDARLPSVRRVFFGGDVLTTEMVASIRRLAPTATVGSFYGATESQRAVGYFEFANESAADIRVSNKSIPLGRGIKDVQLLVLNRSQQLAGIGELGELFVRSPHLAEGYIGDEKRTEQMFIVNPFTNDSQDQLYRTGELGRYLPNGNVEWAGRNDRRVNIRGFRVELEEIEAVLKQHPAVMEAAVVAQNFDELNSDQPNPKSDRRLVAFIVAQEPRDGLIDLLRSSASEKLPDYMVPSIFVVLDKLPLSPNGKVDYHALPPAQLSFAGVTDGFIQPRNETETILCRIFSQVLGIDQVGINDNFFRLGGHSLLAAQAAARIKQALGIGLDLRVFLESPTVVGLARRIDPLISAGHNTAPSAKDAREVFEL